MSDVPANGASEGAALTRAEVVLLVLRFAGGLLLLGLVVTFLGSRYRPELTALGHTVVNTFGLAGMAGGTLVAEAFQFPVPPQFYMLASIAAGVPAGRVLLVITLGSIAGGHLGMFMARKASHLGLVRRVLERGPVARLFRRHGPLAVTIASLLPFPFSIVCYSCGLFRFRYRLFMLVCALRVPKLIVYYAIIRAGFLAG